MAQIYSSSIAGVGIHVNAVTNAAEATATATFVFSTSIAAYHSERFGTGGQHFHFETSGAGLRSNDAVGLTYHVKLDDHFLMIKPNTYQKRPAPTFGARFSTGDSDYNNLSFWQHWVQKCWIGGMGAEEWTDDGMFDTSFSIDTTEHEKARLSRILKRGTGADWTLGGPAGRTGHSFIVWNNVLYVLAAATSVGFDSRLYAYNATAQTWTVVAMPDGFFSAQAMTTYNGSLFIGGHSETTHLPLLYRSVTPGTWILVASPVDAVPASPTEGITALRQYNGKLYVCYGVNVWRLTDLYAWDGNTVFYKTNANSGSNYIAAMETHLGFLYFLSQNGHLHRTDGNNTFDIWAWDGQTSGVSLRSYDGKLFVGTYEYTDTADVGYGVLYQFTGAAVTELKRWGKAGRATSIGQMVVYGRKLYYGASGLFGTANGFGVAVYDVVEDAHSIFATQTDATTYPDLSGVGTGWLVDDVFVFGGHIFVAVRGHGVFFTRDSFKDVQEGLAQYNMFPLGGSLVSSMYDAGTPGLEKLWRKVTVYCNLPAATSSFILSYSIDGGVNYTALPVQVGPSTASDQYVFYLENIRSTRFKWKVQLYTTVETLSPTLRGVVVAYLPQPEPNWMWSFTVPVSDKWLLLDGTQSTNDTNALISHLEAAYRAQVLVPYVDIDGHLWAGCLIYDLVSAHYDVEQPYREGDLRITLLETVETY